MIHNYIASGEFSIGPRSFSWGLQESIARFPWLADQDGVPRRSSSGIEIRPPSWRSPFQDSTWLNGADLQILYPPIINFGVFVWAPELEETGFGVETFWLYLHNIVWWSRTNRVGKTEATPWGRWKLGKDWSRKNLPRMRHLLVKLQKCLSVT